MEQPLDFAVAQATFRVRQIERALHDNGPWQIGYGPFISPAVKFTFADRVTFRAHFPSHCYLVDPDPQMTLFCDGEPVGTRNLPQHPGDGEWIAEWTFALTEPALV